MSYSIKSIRKQFAEQGVFYTDEKLARMLADIVSADGNVVDIYDPTCGNGNLLAVFPDNVEKFGQEINPEQAEEARLRLVNSHIATGDTLKEPAFRDRKFRHIVANYPFSTKWEPAEDERWNDAPVLPPPSKADYAFLLHIISMLADDGVAAVLGFPGILYRGNREGKIREWMCRRNLIDSVTYIEGGYFEDTSISTVLIVFRKNRKSTDITFCDHETGKKATARFEDVVANNFNLSPSGYIPAEDSRKDIDPIQLEIKIRKSILAELDNHLKLASDFGPLHELFGLPPMPPISDFIKDIMNIVNKYI